MESNDVPFPFPSFLATAFEGILASFRHLWFSNVNLYYYVSVSNLETRQQLETSVSSLCSSYSSPSEDEAVLVHVEFACHLQDFDTHLETEEQLVDFKQTTTRVPAEESTHR